MSTGGLEPPQLSPHAPQACVSTIPPHRLIFNYFVILLLNCHFFNTVSVLDVVFDNPLLERYLIVLVGRVPHRLIFDLPSKYSTKFLFCTIMSI